MRKKPYQIGSQFISSQRVGGINTEAFCILAYPPILSVDFCNALSSSYSRVGRSPLYLTKITVVISVIIIFHYPYPVLLMTMVYKCLEAAETWFKTIDPSSSQSLHFSCKAKNILSHHKSRCEILLRSHVINTKAIIYA